MNRDRLGSYQPVASSGSAAYARRATSFVSNEGAAHGLVTLGRRVPDRTKDVSSLLDGYVRRASLCAPVRTLVNPPPATCDVRRSRDPIGSADGVEGRSMMPEGDTENDVYVDTARTVCQDVKYKFYHVMATALTVSSIAIVIVAQAAFNERVVPLFVCSGFSNEVQLVVMVVTVICAIGVQMMRRMSGLKADAAKQYASLSVVLMLVIHSIAKEIVWDVATSKHVYMISKVAPEFIIPAEVGVVKSLTLAAYGAIFARFIPYLSAACTHRFAALVGVFVVAVSVSIGYIEYLSWPVLFPNMYNIFLGSLSFFYFVQVYVQTKSDAIAQRHQSIANYCVALRAVSELKDASVCAIGDISTIANGERRLTQTDSYILDLEQISDCYRKRLKRPSGSDNMVISDEIGTVDV